MNRERRTVLQMRKVKRNSNRGRKMSLGWSKRMHTHSIPYGLMQAMHQGSTSRWEGGDTQWIQTAAVAVTLHLCTTVLYLTSTRDPAQLQGPADNAQVLSREPAQRQPILTALGVAAAHHSRAGKR
jgi:hypothetical protein